MEAVRKGIYDFDADIWSTISEEAKSLISKMLEKGNFCLLLIFRPEKKNNCS
jgi:hypothetical protein